MSSVEFMPSLEQISKGQKRNNINTKVIKEKFASLLNIEPLIKANGLQKLGTNIEQRQTKKTVNFFIFITGLSFGSLGGCVLIVVMDTLALSLGSSFGGMVRVASTSSILCEVSFSLEGSLRVRRGRS